MRVLISRYSALGDTVCTLPVAVSLKAMFPDCHVTWVVDPRFAGVVECCEAVDEVMVHRPKLGRWPKFPARFDLALDMQGLLKSAIPVALSRAKVKLGYHWQREGSALVSRRVLPDPSSFHIVDQYVDVARAAVASIEPMGQEHAKPAERSPVFASFVTRRESKSPRETTESALTTNGTGSIETGRARFGLVPKQEDILAARLKLKQKGIGGRFVAVNPGAGWATKRWPAAHFGRLIDALADRGMPSVLIGGNGKADQAAAQEVTAAAQNPPASLLGETSVRELVALIRLASAHVGGDTGSTHIAAALDVGAIGLYSITRPERSCPYGQIDRCHYDPRGLSFIEPEAVIETVFRTLEA